MKIHIIKIAFLSCFLYLSGSSITFAQEDANLRPFRVGLKLLVPNLTGMTVEYVMPFAKNHFSLMGDFSYFGLTVSDVKANYTYFGFGANYYLNSKGIGRGPYVGIGYGRLSFDTEISNIDSEVNSSKTGGVADAKLGSNAIQFKIGLKTGKKGFYFAPEIGYALLNFDERVDMKVKFPDNTVEDQSIIVSDKINNYGFIFNLTFGVAF